MANYFPLIANTSAAQIQEIPSGDFLDLSESGIANCGNITVDGVISATGNITGGNLSGTSISGTLITAAQTNITSVGTLSSLSVTGNISGGNLSVSTGTITGGNIVNANGNGVGNIGSASLYFNTVFAKATSAQYADLAEVYLADQPYEPGTVVEIGGTAEVTETKTFASPRIAGVVSTDPAFIMNSAQTDPNAVKIALLGRVPCRVVGQIRRGDLLVSSSVSGHATAVEPVKYVPGCVIGKALENHDTDEPGVIEIMVGRL